MKVKTLFQDTGWGGTWGSVICYNYAAAPPGFQFGGNILGGRPRRGSGGGAPPRTPEKFENFQKISLKNCKKFL